MATTRGLPIVTPTAEPAIVANSVPAVHGDVSPTESSTSDALASKKKHKTAEAEELERQIEALAVPGYSIHQEGVFTVIRKVHKTDRSQTFPARLAR